MSSKPKANPNPNRTLRSLDQLAIRSIKHLAYHTKVSEHDLGRMAASPEKFFRAGFFRDKKGVRRPKAEPIGPLAVFQRNLNTLLQRVQLPVTVHGGRKGKSYITNAQQHVGQPLVMAFDIRTFFPSISRQRVFRAFRERLGCSAPIADIISHLTTFHDELAQGASASTIIAAIVAEPILKRIQELVKPEGGLATIYVDDINISGTARLARHKSVVCSIIKQAGYSVKWEKVKIMRAHKEQIVTGNAVNKQIDLPSKKLIVLWDTLRTFEGQFALGVYPSLADLVKLEGSAKHLRVLNPGSGSAMLRRVSRLIKNRPLENVVLIHRKLGY